VVPKSLISLGCEMLQGIYIHQGARLGHSDCATASPGATLALPEAAVVKSLSEFTRVGVQRGGRGKSGGLAGPSPEAAVVTPLSNLIGVEVQEGAASGREKIDGLAAELLEFFALPEVTVSCEVCRSLRLSVQNQMKRASRLTRDVSVT
jgi:hypothetical protein